MHAASHGRLPAEENTAALLGQAYAQLGQRIVEGVVAAGFPQRPAHSAVFANIDADGTRLTTLAERANMTPQSMAELVNDLEHMGYLRRQPDPTDRRAKLITLTARGHASVTAARETISQLEMDLEQLVGTRALRQLRSTLRRILTSK